MIYKLFPIKDAAIYSSNPQMNTGLDEIIESSQTTGILPNPSPQTSRFLIQFDNTEIGDVINNKISGSVFSASLRCFIAVASGMSLPTILEAFPISASWTMGTGRYLDSPEVQNGTSWLWRDYSGSNAWTTSSFGSGITGSWSGSEAGGGTWFTSSVSQSFNYPSSKDINMDITSFVNSWYSGSLKNDGIIIKNRTEFVNNINVQPVLKYFSVDTHTIYPPCLEFKWRDYNWNTGSSSSTILTTIPFTTTLEENPGIFFSDSINIFRVYNRPEYPVRVFQTASLYTTNYYLPTASYYAIKDLDTNEMVVDFDNQFTQISADSTSNYFKVDMNGLEPERYYSILIKTNIGGNTIVLDDNDYNFKVING